MDPLWRTSGQIRSWGEYPDSMQGRVLAIASRKGGTGKSTIALHACAAVGLGMPWLSFPVTQGPALFIDAEDHTDVIWRRTRKGGVTDTVISRLLDIMWAFPIYLLAISLSIVLIAHGIEIGPFTIESGSLELPIFIIGLVYVPYVARPIRGQVMSLRKSEFVMASIGLGASSGRILWRDILPNISTTLIVFTPLMLAKKVRDLLNTCQEPARSAEAR